MQIQGQNRVVTHHPQTRERSHAVRAGQSLLLGHGVAGTRDLDRVASEDSHRVAVGLSEKEEKPFGRTGRVGSPDKNSPFFKGTEGILPGEAIHSAPILTGRGHDILEGRAYLARGTAYPMPIPRSWALSSEQPQTTPFCVL